MGRSAKRKQFKRQLLREKQFRTILAEKSIEDTDETEEFSLIEETTLQNAEHFAYSLGDFKKALEILSPLLSTNTPSLEVLACAFFAATHIGNFEVALNYLDIIKLDKKHGVGLAKIKGDILLKNEKTSEAIYYYNEEIKKNDIQAKLIGLFSRAWAKLKNGNIAQAIEDTTEGVQWWFDDIARANFISVPEEGVVGTKHGLFSFENPVECIVKVCRNLLEQTKDEPILDKKLKGQLSYLLYSFGGNEINLLLEAADLIDHPKLSFDLLYHFLANNDLNLAVHHHIRYFLWEHNIQSRSENVFFVDSDFDYPYDTKLINTKTKCLKVHKTAMKHLKLSKEAEVIHDVFIPFYRSFWRKLLLDKTMYTEIIEVTSIFIAYVDDSSVFWDHAFYLHEMKDNSKAEKAYRNYLEKWPNSPAAMHNLSIILGEKGEYQEAFQLSSKAVAIVPNDEIIVKRSKYLEENLVELQKDFEKKRDWAYAYSLHQRKLIKEAEKAYRDFIKKWSDHANAAYNLSIILEQNGNIEEALELSNKTILINPTNNSYIKHNNSLKEKFNQKNKNKQEELDLFRSAPERWHLVDYYKRSLLISLLTITSFNNWKHLSELTGLEEKYLPGHWRKLTELGMIIDENDQYRINEYVRPLIKQHQISPTSNRFTSIETRKVAKSILNTNIPSPFDEIDLTSLSQKEIKLFYCYAHEDKDLRDELAIHLSNLKRQIQFIDWHDREILSGMEWEKEIDSHLNSANIILLLISARFMASDYCYGIEMKKALERHSNKEAYVIPILLRPVDWTNAPFSKIQILPTNVKPVTSWLDRDEAFTDVAKGIRAVVENMLLSSKVNSK